MEISPVSSMKIINSTQLTTGWLTMFLLGTDLFAFSPLIPIVAADFRIAPGATGLGVAVFSFTYMVTASPLGYLADQIGRRRLLICSLFAFGVANLLTACAADLHSLLIARAFAGAAAAGVSPSVYALVGNAAPPERRATWLSIVVSGLLLSLAIGASTGALVGGLFGWRPVFVTLAILSLALVTINCRVWASHLESEVVSGTRSTFSVAWLLLARRMVPTVVWSTSLYSVYTLSWYRTRFVGLLERSNGSRDPILWMWSVCRSSGRRAPHRPVRRGIHNRSQSRRPLRLFLTTALVI
jgi:predicted MFS family arabinose efflux permease